jgi:hypothetical protein
VRPAMSAAVGEIVDVRIAAVDGDTLLGSSE